MSGDVTGPGEGDECPRCQQDRIERYTIRATAEPILVCPECEAAWRTSSTNATDFVDLTVLLESLGLPPLFSELLGG